MDIARVLVAVVTLLLTLGMLGLTVFAFTIPHFGMAAVCFLIAIGFGVFVVHDYKHFFGAKKDETPK